MGKLNSANENANLCIDKGGECDPLDHTGSVIRSPHFDRNSKAQRFERCGLPTGSLVNTMTGSNTVAELAELAELSG